MGMLPAERLTRLMSCFNAKGFIALGHCSSSVEGLMDSKTLGHACNKAS